MTPVRIIGIGSDGVGDRAGWQALAQLQQAGFAARFESGQVSLQTCRFPAQLMQLLDGCRLALLIDAVQAEPGVLLNLNTNDLVAWKSLHSTHGIGVGEALQLVERLSERPPAVRVLGIGVGNSKTACTDAQTHALIPALIERLDAEISLHLDSADKTLPQTGSGCQ